ncbi:MAG: translocation/assembly module TamB domain-containing protein [Methylophilaceae bacterium]
MLRRTLSFLTLGLFLLALSPAWGDFSLNGNTSLDAFSHDLDNIHISLEKLNADWQLTPSGGNQLTIHHLRATRMTVKLKDGTSETESELPEQIKLPLPILVQQASIAEVVIITKNAEYTLTNVNFNFDGNTKSLTLNLQNAETPWGNTKAVIRLATANPFAITGKVNLNNSKDNIPYDVEALISGNLDRLSIDSQSKLVMKDSQIALIKPNENIASTAADITTHIDLSLTDDYPIKVATSVNKLRPERLRDFPTAELNFDINLQGNLLPQPDLRVSFISHDSQWQKQAFSSSGELVIHNTDMLDINLQAALLDNKFSAKGDLNLPNSKLEWLLDMPNLSDIGADYAGQAFASGSIEGPFDNLALRFDLKAEKLQIAEIITTEKLTGKAMLMAGDNGKFEGEFNASKLQYISNPIVDSTIRINGTRNDHQIKITAANQDLKFESSLNGGLITSDNWQGVIQSFAYQGKTSITLQAPAKLNLSPQEISLQNAKLTLLKGQAFIENLKLGSNHFSSKGQIEALSLADLPPAFLTLPNQMQGDLTISGLWDMQASDTVNGKLSVWRKSGDISLNSPNNKPLPLGLNEAKINAVFDQNKTDIDVTIAGKQLGTLNTHLNTTLTKTDKGYALLAGAPFKLSSKAQLSTLAWLPLPATLSDADIDGQLSFNVNADGTIQSPNLSGMVTGKNLQLSLLSEGVALTEGTIEATFNKDQLHIKQAKWKGDEGYLTTVGAIRLGSNQTEISLDWQAEKFTALARTDRRLTLTGVGNTLLKDGLLTITGNFTADKGFIQLAEEGTPKLGDDVIIVGKSESKSEADLKILLNGLRIDLGNDFIIRGQGIDAQLAGAMTLTGLSQYHPHAEGSIQIKKGTYLAYGQVLVIEEGRFTFSGPLDNPGVNLRAMRNSTPVNAGIEITGSAYVPVTKLVSEPSVPDSEKLSWLVLGHGMDQTAGNEFSMLSLAAGAILTQGQSVPLQTQLARAAGLDELSFSGGDSESTALTLGKRLSSKLYLSYQKSINGLLDVARLTFNLTPRWSLRAESGTESAVDVLYTFSFQ